MMWLHDVKMKDKSNNKSFQVMNLWFKEGASFTVIFCRCEWMWLNWACHNLGLSLQCLSLFTESLCSLSVLCGHLHVSPLSPYLLFYLSLSDFWVFRFSRLHSVILDYSCLFHPWLDKIRLVFMSTLNH